MQRRRGLRAAVAERCRAHQSQRRDHAEDADIPSRARILPCAERAAQQQEERSDAGDCRVGNILPEYLRKFPLLLKEEARRKQRQRGRRADRDQRSRTSAAALRRPQQKARQRANRRKYDHGQSAQLFFHATASLSR